MSLHLQQVAAHPGGVEVLHDVSLAVADGRCTAVLGPSGAGKTTLLRVVAGLEALHAGSIELDGETLEGPPERRPIAVVFQDARLFPSMNVTENVRFPLRMAGAPAARQATEVADALADVGLDGFGDRSVRTLSGGEAQRVALARALVAAPRVLLLDEPFAAVDPDRREDLRRLVARLLKERRITTLLVTHDRDDAALLGNEVAVLLGGRIAQVGSVRQVFDQPTSLEIARFVGCDVVLPDGDGVLVTRPEQVILGTGPHEGTVTDVAHAADHARVRLELRGGMTTVPARVAVGDAPAIGASIRFDLPNAWRLPQDVR